MTECIRVRDVMKEHVDLVSGSVSVAEAVREMRHVETKCLIVDKRHDNDEYGIVLISDISRQVLARDRAPERVNIFEVMTKPVVSVHPDMQIRYCARLLENLGLSRAPVLNEAGEIIGIVSHTDLVLKGLSRGEVE
ncbi:MAG: CBS domain-containing protein [Arachnia sp.]